MKLLLDQNLSPRLVNRLDSLHPGTQHVAALDLDEAEDVDIWRYAAAHGYTIVTKDEDFADLLDVRGHPPKVIWLRIGNCTTAQIEDLLRQHAAATGELAADPTLGLLMIG